MADPYAKTSSREENDRIEYAASCTKGLCDDMQNYYTTILELGGSDITSFFGVFDGRGGDEVGVHCFKQFHTQLIKDPAYENDPRTAMENAYLRIGGQLEEINESRKSYSSGNSNTKYKWPQKEGSTSCAVLIRGNHIIVGNVGDSHCLLSRNGQGIDISFNDNLSRTSGDLKSKQNEGLSPSEQQMTCNRNIYTENITHDVDFLLLIASKGIWHDTKNQHVVDFVHKLLKSGDVDPCGICERIIDSYTEPGDNSTVILVQFKDGALVSSKTSEFDGTNILEEIWYEILVRVSSKMIIRCRSVCKQWLNITTTPKFIEHHHGEQKLQLIVPVHYSGNMYSCLHRVLAINLSCMEDGFQTIIRSTTFGKYKPRDGEDEAKHIVSVVHASVDGLLLLSFDKTCYVVNPATRKSSHLAPVDNAQKVLGLYRHTLTGEYRVLYLRAVDEDLEEEGPEDDEPFCILSIALQNTRSILLTPYVYARLVFAMDGQPPAVIGDHLYWAPSAFEKQITVFDSKSEVFRWMESPAKNSKNSTIKLIELKGKPAVSSSTKGASKVELFMLEMEGCQSESWVRSHTVELPAEELNHSWAGRFESFFVSLDGDILIECVWRDGDREKKSPGQLLYRDQNGELDVLLEAYLGTSPVHVLKESLASHSFLNDHHPGSPLFEGL